MTVRKIVHNPDVRRALKCSRWKVWDLCKNDPDFPKPRDIAGKQSWFEDEIETYKETRPRRIYATVAAVLAVVGVTAISFANFFLA